MQIHIKTELRTGVSHRALATAGCPVEAPPLRDDQFVMTAVVYDRLQRSARGTGRFVGKVRELGMGYGA